MRNQIVVIKLKHTHIHTFHYTGYPLKHQNFKNLKSIMHLLSIYMLRKK